MTQGPVRHKRAGPAFHGIPTLTALPDLGATLAPTMTDREPVLQARLSARRALLRERLARLYGTHPRFDVWFEALLQNTLAAAMRRPAALWRLDLAREQDTDWFRRGGVGYCAYADRFGGTLRGVAQRIVDAIANDEKDLPSSAFSV